MVDCTLLNHLLEVEKVMTRRISREPKAPTCGWRRVTTNGTALRKNTVSGGWSAAFRPWRKAGGEAAEKEPSYDSFQLYAAFHFTEGQKPSLQPRRRNDASPVVEKLLVKI
jgi:hypothetical protein